MAQIKNKTTIYAVVRRNIDASRDVVCCFTKTLDAAEKYCDQYEQTFIDSGGVTDEAYFYVVGNTFYDE